MIEKEIKVLLSEKQYNKLKDCFEWEDGFTQINYYYESNDGITIRIREQDNLKLQVKIPRQIKSSLHIKDEYEMQIDKIYEIISSELLKKITNYEFGYDRKIIGKLKTERKICRKYRNVEICLDKNDYLDMVDYEIEVEYTNDYPVEVIEKIKKLGINCEEYSRGKNKRFLQRLENIN